MRNKEIGRVKWSGKAECGVRSQTLNIYEACTEMYYYRSFLKHIHTEEEFKDEVILHREDASLRGQRLSKSSVPNTGFFPPSS